MSSLSQIDRQTNLSIFNMILPASNITDCSQVTVIVSLRKGGRKGEAIGWDCKIGPSPFPLMLDY